MKTVEFAANAVKRWPPIFALYASTLQTWTRILITVKNVESAGELARGEKDYISMCKMCFKYFESNPLFLFIIHTTVLVSVQKTHETSTNIPLICT